MRPFYPLLLAAFVALPGCHRAQTPATTPTHDDVIDSDFAGATNAVEFPADMTFLNTDRPLRLRDLRGKIVLLDFWTYCCINCIHVLPDLKRIEEEYPEVVVVGVHSAKFQNEQDVENIRQAILRYDIAHPVAVDNEFYLWRQYGVQAWPSFALIDPRGKLVGTTSGEQVYDQLQPYLEGMKKLFSARGELNAERLDFSLERAEAPKSLLAYPGKLDVDPATGRLFFTDSNHNRVVITAADGTVIDIIGTGAEGATDGSYEAATFYRPQGIAYDPATNVLYVADTENHLVRRIDLTTRTVETLLGTGSQSHRYTSYANGTADAINSPWDVVLRGGTVYIAMAGPHQLWELNPTTRQAKVYAGSGRENIVDGSRLEAALAQPSGIATDGTRLYFADSEVSALRKVENDQVKTLIGEGLFEFGDVDGTFPAARLQHVLGVTWHAGKLYLADTYNHKIKVYDPATGQLSTLLGTGKRGSSDGAAQKATFNEPNDLAWLGGKLYITDTNNHLVRVYDPATGEVTTLPLGPAERLSQLETKRKRPEAVFYGQTVEVPAAEIAPTGATLELRVQLPKGYKLNPEAPNYLTLVGATSAPVTFTEAAGVLSARLPLGAPNAGTLVVEAGIYYCETGREAVCKIQQVQFRVPVTPQAGGTTKLVVPYVLKAD
ncbi:MAG: thioredoxin-like domain-containing protein [Bacteroidia bacterium]|nr:thioredoxin-like domain-containing protein [Bacteroidia bacterium]